MVSRRDGDLKFIEVRGRRLHYRELCPEMGGASLVFLHEGLGSVELWRDFPSVVCEATKRRGLVFSRYGHGRSDLLTESRRAGYMHDEALGTLPDLIDTLLDENPILVGHSDGASISLIYAGSGYPVEALILIAPHVFVEPTGVQRITNARAAFEGSEMPDRMKEYHIDAGTTFYGWADIWVSEEFRDWNIEEYLPSITCPTLLIQSKADEYGSSEQLDRIQGTVPSLVERLLVDGGSHSPHLANADEVTAATVQFINQLKGKS